MDAASAGFRVGYEDPSHFSREYKRHSERHQMAISRACVAGCRFKKDEIERQRQIDVTRETLRELMRRPR